MLMRKKLHLTLQLPLIALLLFMELAYGQKDVGDKHLKAIPTAAGSSICALSKTLKEIPPWTVKQLKREVQKIKNIESKMLEWQLNYLQKKSETHTKDCAVGGDLFKETQEKLTQARAAVDELELAAIQSAGFAGISSGRLDEFITVFANAKTNDGRGCFFEKGDVVKSGNLEHCFGKEKGKDFSEESLVKITEDPPTEEPNLEDALGKVNHSVVSAYFSVEMEGEDGCNLINGAEGIVGENLNNHIWWGGGIFTIGKSFGGDLRKENFAPGEIKNAENQEQNAFWTASPTKIPHLENATEAFKNFKEARKKIEEKFKEVENQIQKCVSDQRKNKSKTDGQRTTIATHTCLKKVTELAADLKATNALLFRHQEENRTKIPLSSESDAANKTVKATTRSFSVLMKSVKFFFIISAII